MRPPISLSLLLLLAVLALPCLALASPAEDLHAAYMASDPAYRQADADLNAAWKRLKAVCSPDELKLELKRQREWLKKRNERLLAGAGAASVAGMMEERAGRIEARAEELGGTAGRADQARSQDEEAAPGSAAEAVHRKLLESSYAYAKADFLLNAAWLRLKDACAPDQYRRELKLQRAWLKRRDERLLAAEGTASAVQMAEDRARALDARRSRLLPPRNGDDCVCGYCGRARELDQSADPEKLAADAERGDADAQLDLALLHGLYGGTLLWRDDGLSLRWLRRAAEGGSPEAKYLLGARLVGWEATTAEEFVSGLRLLEEAADAGVECAPSVLSDAYRDGGQRSMRDDPLVEPDPAKADRWLERARRLPGGDPGGDGGDEESGPSRARLEEKALRGDSEAALSLHFMCEDGSGTAPDPRGAARWLEVFYFLEAGDDGVAHVPHALHVSPMDVAEAWRKAGDGRRAAIWYGWMYELSRDGRSVFSSTLLAELGDVWFDGELVPKDDGRALRLYSGEVDRALLMGSIELAAGDLLFDEARDRLFRAAFRTGGLLCFGPNPTPRGYARGRACFELLEERVPAAAYNLGVIHADGLGVPRDRGRADAYFRSACDRGFRQACEALRR